VEGALVAKKKLSAEEKAADKAAKKEAEKGKRAWKLISTAIPLASGIATTKALDATWRTATGRKPPTKPENPAITHREALLWAALSGMALGVAKTYVTRRAAIYWVRSFGRVPPGMDEPDAKDKVRLSRLARGRS
jgi:uncharacterized protein DUF4235